LAGKGMARRPVENHGRKRTCHIADVPGKVNAQEWCNLGPQTSADKPKERKRPRPIWVTRRSSNSPPPKTAQQ